MKYRINWVSKTAPMSGYGGPVFDTYESAAAYAAELNEQYPDIEHEATKAHDLTTWVTRIDTGDKASDEELAEIAAKIAALKAVADGKRG